MCTVGLVVCQSSKGARPWSREEVTVGGFFALACPLKNVLLGDPYPRRDTTSLWPCGVMCWTVPEAQWVYPGEKRSHVLLFYCFRRPVGPWRRAPEGSTMREKEIHIIEFGLQAKPSILYVGIVTLAARRDHDYHGHSRIYYYNLVIDGFIIIVCWRSYIL